MKRVFLIFVATMFIVLAFASVIYGFVVAGSLYYEKYYGLETLHQEYELLIFLFIFLIPISIFMIEKFIENK